VSKHSLLCEPSVLLFVSLSFEKKYRSSFKAHMCRCVALLSVSWTCLTFLGVVVSLKLEMNISLPSCYTRSRKHQGDIGLGFFL